MTNYPLKSAWALLLAVLPIAAAQAADSKESAAKAAVAADIRQAPSEAAKDIGLTLLDKGTDKNWQHYMLDDAAAHVSAASLAGIAPSAVTIAESTRDFGLLVQATDPKNKGGGVAITPARASRPFPRVDLANYLNNPRKWQPLVNLTISYAQGVSEVDGTNYRRRAVAVSTNGTFHPEDDPVWVRVKAMDCASDTIAKATLAAAVGSAASAASAPSAAAASGSLSEDATVDSPAVIKLPKVAQKLEECAAQQQTQFDQRWFRPIWSLTLATGDVGLDGSGSSSVRMGESLAVAARYGAPIGKPPPDESFEWGWALSASAKLNHREPVLASVGTAQVQHQNSHWVALRAAAGTDTVRLLGEASNVKVRAAQGGEQTLKRALGIDYRVAPGWWLNFRYGRREKASGDGEESAGLLTLTISPSALKVN